MAGKGVLLVSGKWLSGQLEKYICPINMWPNRGSVSPTVQEEPPKVVLISFGSPMGNVHSIDADNILEACQLLVCGRSTVHQGQLGQLQDVSPKYPCVYTVDQTQTSEMAARHELPLGPLATKFHFISSLARGYGCLARLASKSMFQPSIPMLHHQKALPPPA